MKSALLEKDRPKIININSHTISFATEEVPKSLIGAPVSSVALGENQTVYGVVHEDLSLDVYQGQKLLLAAGDQIIVSTVVD